MLILIIFFISVPARYICLKNVSSKFREINPAIKYYLISEECAPEHPAIDDFPSDIFTQQERASGFIIIHIIVVLYFFILLSILCDFYFVPSLQQICIWLKLESDVAGATLMAIGSSAPTLFIAIISVFFTSGAGEIGLGTIVGSTIFNTLFIISACGFSISHSMKLKWYPIVRDSIAYLISIIALVISVRDKIIHWYEAMIFVLIYILYVIAMAFNKKIEHFFINVCKKIHVSKKENEILLNLNNISNESDPQNCELIEYIGPFIVPNGKYEKFIWFSGWPLILIISIFLPNLLKRKLPVLYEILRFGLSMILLGFLSYVLVWMVCIIGYTFKIPDCVMGMTLLAAGSSIPDVMASIAVSKHNQAAMGISNAIGSNVFDMLCLGLPWLIKTTIISRGSVIEIESESLILSTSLLIGTMLYTDVCFYLNSWVIDRKIAILFLTTYVSIMCE
ncbi:hypothetical protein HZS_4604 [Henneguya salminicola]|nr:hypothetical protein HZS_4604 [Henneguya salminicola]